MSRLELEAKIGVLFLRVESDTAQLQQAKEQYVILLRKEKADAEKAKRNAEDS